MNTNRAACSGRAANVASRNHRQLLMGAEGEKWDTARIAVSSQERIKLLLDFPRFRRAIESMIEKAQNKASGDPMTLAAALISKYRNGSGVAHFERLVRGAMEAYDWHAKKWKHRKICAGSISFDKFRVKLPRHFLDGAKFSSWRSMAPCCHSWRTSRTRVGEWLAQWLTLSR